MEITEEQRGLIQKMADEGSDLGEIQKRIADELKITVTYLETRMLISDLGIVFPEEEKDDAKGQEAVLLDSGTPEDLSQEDLSPAPDLDPAGSVPGTGTVSVTLSELAPPGMIANGTVTFSDGEKAEWYLDQMGRLGLDPTKPDYHPSESDIVAFQKELKRLAEVSGL